jgi:hypothetical protein
MSAFSFPGSPENWLGRTQSFPYSVLSNTCSRGYSTRVYSCGQKTFFGLLTLAVIGIMIPPLRAKIMVASYRFRLYGKTPERGRVLFLAHV